MNHSVSLGSVRSFFSLHLLATFDFISTKWLSINFRIFSLNFLFRLFLIHSLAVIVRTTTLLNVKRMAK